VAGLIGAALAAPTPVAAPGDRVLALWLTEERDAHVRIERVGATYEGRIVWLKEPDYPADDAMAGRPKVDRENPLEALRGTPIMGLRIVQGFRFDDGEWRDGTIYDPNNGKTYRCRMWFDGETLRVRGYIGIPLLGRSTSWTRVTEPAG
jgi:uncharacterized protein (DUF2147 family)